MIFGGIIPLQVTAIYHFLHYIILHITYYILHITYYILHITYYIYTYISYLVILYLLGHFSHLIQHVPTHKSPRYNSRFSSSLPCASTWIPFWGYPRWRWQSDGKSTIFDGVFSQGKMEKFKGYVSLPGGALWKYVAGHVFLGWGSSGFHEKKTNVDSVDICCIHGEHVDWLLGVAIAQHQDQFKRWHQKNMPKN